MNIHNIDADTHAYTMERLNNGWKVPCIKASRHYLMHIMIGVFNANAEVFQRFYVVCAMCVLFLFFSSSRFALFGRSISGKKEHNANRDIRTILQWVMHQLYSTEIKVVFFSLCWKI